MLYLSTSAQDIHTAVELLQSGQQVALPTETVYGLAADASNPQAVRGIFEAKGRPADHPLIVHLATAEWMSLWASHVPEIAWRLAEVFWPGPLTLVLPVASTVTPLVTGGQPTVALRVPAHPVMQAVLKQLGKGLAAPSANPFGQISPTTAAHVRRHLQGRIAAVVDGGPCGVGIESTILDLSGERPTILRPGAITADMLKPYLQVVDKPAVDAPRVPGSLASHYAPRTPCFRIAPDFDHQPMPGQQIGVLAMSPPSWPIAHFWQMPAEPEAYAQALYAMLHEADSAGCDALFIVLPPQTPAWLAVLDRVNRATREFS
ncbi:L-threonylcarbamoyladenylate synthase [Chitinivorax tropicus]|uniref:Threonylcarbamoyl-AMP synthase n=1 Tax=Chitinivorax tropicus TaxID=714531 RepID=A0A840MVK8_9PROT|nr:L-threonylcarbamoyladenylate synthase [Chitinivorax tropicus]MBB5020383.1 L-threonylcarbamoyladenylate synthase [Chitinivorax tropicus]